MRMLENVAIGIGAGLLFSISFGPVFFAITETSLKRGFWAGATVALGISVSDVIFVSLILAGLSRWFQDPQYTSVFALVGGLLLTGFGMSLLLKRKIGEVEVTTKRNPIQNFLKGFLINSLHPYVPVFWIGVVAYTTAQLDLNRSGSIQFFGAVLVTLLIVDVLKSYLAEILRHKVIPFATRIFRVIGLVFLGFGMKLLYDFLATTILG